MVDHRDPRTLARSLFVFLGGIVVWVSGLFAYEDHPWILILAPLPMLYATFRFGLFAEGVGRVLFSASGFFLAAMVGYTSLSVFFPTAEFDLESVAFFCLGSAALIAGLSFCAGLIAMARARGWEPAERSCRRVFGAQLVLSLCVIVVWPILVGDLLGQFRIDGSSLWLIFAWAAGVAHGLPVLAVPTVLGSITREVERRESAL